MIQSFRTLPVRTQTWVIIAAFVVVSFLINFTEHSADFFALYLAAYNFADGNLAAVYPDPTPMYQLSVPDNWDQQANDLGITERPLFPFIYPPLWAAVFSPVTQAISPQVFALSGFVINPALMGLCAVLTHRIMEPKMDLALWTLIALVFVGATSFGYVALFQNQPQILVSALIVLAIERNKSGSNFAAGAIMALAASIKLYPVLFAIFWLATRNFRALSAFFAVGGCLGLTSIFVAGWPLHQEFLDQIETIAHSFISCQICLNLDATLTQWVMADFLINQIGIRDPNASEVVNVVVSVKPEIYRMTDRILMLAAIALLYLAVFRASDTRLYRSVWPAIFIVVALLSPLTWSYHYLSVVFFLPVFIEHYRRGWAIFLGLGAVFSVPVLLAIDYAPTPFYLGQFLGTAGIVWILILFLWMKDDSEPAPP